MFQIQKDILKEVEEHISFLEMLIKNQSERIGFESIYDMSSKVTVSEDFMCTDILDNEDIGITERYLTIAQAHIRYLKEQLSEISNQKGEVEYTEILPDIFLQINNLGFFLGLFSASIDECNFGEIKKMMSKKATDVRYGASRLLLDRLKKVAFEKWRNGSKLMHHQMKEHLLNEYSEKGGTVPFSCIPEKTALKAVKIVAKEMNRPDLISGQKN